MLFIKTILIILCHHLVITDIVFAQNNFNSGKLKLKVSDAIFLALRENRSIKSAYIDRIAQKYTLSVAEDQFNPDLFITPSMNQTSNKSSGDRATTNQAGIKLNIPLQLKTGGKFNFSWNNEQTSLSSGDNSFRSSWDLKFSQPLLRGFGFDVATSNLILARITNQNRILGLQNTIMTTVTSVINAHRNYQRTSRQKKVAERALNRNIKLLEVNKELVKAGRLAKSQIIQTTADLATKKFNVLTAKNDLLASRLSLIQTLDINQNILLDAIEERKVSPLNKNYDSLIRVALNNRPDYLQALNNLNVRKIGLGLAKNRRLWELNFEGGIGESRQENSFENAIEGLNDLGKTDWNIGLKLTIPFGDRFRHAPFVNALTTLKNQRIQLKEIKQNIEIEIQNRLRDLNIKYQQVILAKQATLLSKEKLKVENERLRSGRSTNFQVVTFQNDLLTAETNEINAIINYKNGLSNLDLALGTTLKTWEIEMAEKPESWSQILMKLDRDIKK
tara:strand:+ start:910 stop:2421 length:1512 start_codon:yes stop_codon:yes gene_type:complete